MSLKAAAPVVVNLGCEMLYILDQRLKAQDVASEKGAKVLEDVLRTMLDPAFFNEKLVQAPQDLYSVGATRRIFDRLAHSSIMRLSESRWDGSGAWASQGSCLRRRGGRGCSWARRGARRRSPRPAARRPLMQHGQAVRPDDDGLQVPAAVLHHPARHAPGGPSSPAARPPGPPAPRPCGPAARPAADARCPTGGSSWDLVRPAPARTPQPSHPPQRARHPAPDPPTRRCPTATWTACAACSSRAATHTSTSCCRARRPRWRAALRCSPQASCTSCARRCWASCRWVEVGRGGGLEPPQGPQGAQPPAGQLAKPAC
jgi:hypothetical protein